MNKEQTFNEFIHYLNNDIQSKDYLTYREQNEWKDYLEEIIDICTTEQQQEIDRLNEIIKKKNKQINDMYKFYKDKIKSLKKVNK